MHMCWQCIIWITQLVFMAILIILPHFPVDWFFGLMILPTFFNGESSRKMPFHSQVFWLWQTCLLALYYLPLILLTFSISGHESKEYRSGSIFKYHWPLIFSFKSISIHLHTCLLLCCLLYFLIEQGIAPTRNWFQTYLNVLWS